MKISAASERANHYIKGNSKWFCGFAYTEVNGLGYENGIHRRDPSSIIQVNGLYYVWYTKSFGEYFTKKTYDDYAKKFPWDYADIYYATSPNGIDWTEKGCAVARGKAGEYDERTVCTPEILAHNGKYYLVYQAMEQIGEYRNGAEFVTMSVADRPDGPWVKTNKKLVDRMPVGEWFGKGNNYNSKMFKGPTHDPLLMYYKDKFYLYYKGAHGRITDMPDEHGNFCGNDTRWCVAISENIEGPYTPSEYNPITNSGHETLLWPYKGGVAALLNKDGPEKDTIQYAEDGINFEIMSIVRNTPIAGGAFRSPNPDLTPLEGLRWGLCHVDERSSNWNYLVRFDIDMRSNSSWFSHCYPISNCGGLIGG